MGKGRSPLTGQGEQRELSEEFRKREPPRVNNLDGLHGLPFDGFELLAIKTSPSPGLDLASLK